MLVECHRGNDDIVDVGSGELKVIQESIHLSLDIWNRIDKSHNCNIEYLLAAMADDSKTVSMRSLYRPLVEEPTGIDDRNVTATTNHINDVFLYRDRV